MMIPPQPIELLKAARKHLVDAERRRGTPEGAVALEVAISYTTLAITRLEAEVKNRKAADRKQS